MNSLIALVAALSLAAPASPGPGAPRQVSAPFRALSESYRPQVQHQVRIEQRVIIRISPSPPEAREEMLARLPRQDMPTRYRERKFDGCIPIDAIAGAEPVQNNRLLLFMRDHRVLSAALERACDAEAFYLGFYVERSADGMLCSKRDKLQSRTGTICEVTQLNRLVALKD